MKGKVFSGIVVIFFAIVLPIQSEETAIWYFGSSDTSNASSNPLLCGKTRDVPCTDINVIFGFQFSCAKPNNFTAGRNSTRIVFLQGVHNLFPVCFKEWNNVEIVADQGARSQINSRLASALGVFSFENCVNVSVYGLEFDTVPVGRSALYFLETEDVYVSNCRFVLSVIATVGINLQGIAGSVIISENIFFGNITDSEAQPIRGIIVSQRHVSQSEAGEVNLSLCEQSRLMQSNLHIVDCTFKGLIVQLLDPSVHDDDLYSYSKASGVGSAIQMTFDSNICGQEFAVNNNLFEDIVAIGGSSVLVTFRRYSSGNTVGFFGNSFKNNRASYGGGVGIFHWSNTMNNSVSIQKSVFSDNEAVVEGGAVFCVFLSKYTSNQLHVESSHFLNNSALYGAACHIANAPYFIDPPNDISDLVAPPLVKVYVTNCSFVNNYRLSPASLGVVVFTRIDMSLTGDNEFLWNTASALVAVSSFVRASGHVMFVGNNAKSGSCMYLLLGSRVDMTEVEMCNFTNNFASTGSIIGTDTITSSVTVAEHLHSRSDNPSSLTGCFLQFNNRLNPIDEPTRFIFQNNTATFLGSLFAVNSLDSCDVGYFVPSNVTDLVSLFQSNNVVEYINSPLQSGLATAPSFAVFYGASTQCYKTVGNFTYLLPNCSHQLLQEMFLEHADLQCALQSVLSSEFPFVPGYGLHPIVDHLIVPWAGIIRQWDDPANSRRQVCVEPNVSNIILSPAPGEQFDITIQVLDQMLNLAGSTAILQVTADKPGVLLQANGLQYGSTDRLYFTPNRALTEIALGGLPGTKGTLVITLTSRVLFKPLTLNIPFQLANCPLGLLSPLATPQMVEDIIRSSFLTQRLPNSNPLACRCISEVYRGFAHGSIACVRGYTATLSQILWMGILVKDEVEKSGGMLETTCPIRAASSQDLPNDAVTNWVKWNAKYRIERRRQGASYPLLASEVLLSPVDVASYEGSIVPGGGAPVKCYSTANVSQVIKYKIEQRQLTVIYPCPAGYCKIDPSGVWTASNTSFPCVDKREGVLCGQCKEGFAVTPLSTVCRDCRDSNPALIVILYLFFGLLVVVGSILLNIGAIPALDTLLFFFQATLVLLSNRPGFQSFSYLALFSNLDFSFDLCFTPDMNALGKSLWGYFSPTYILLLIGILVALTRVKVISKYLGKHSYLQALWLLLLLSYVNLLLSSFSILNCVGIGEGQLSRYVLVDDASIHCLEGGHLAAAVVSILLLATVILPFPLYLTVLIYFPRWKPFTDVYSSVYKNNRRWWVFFVLFKRIIVVVLGIFVQNFLLRQYFFVFWFLIISMIYGWFLPYPNQVDNAIELFAVLILTVIAMLSIGTITQNGISEELALLFSWLLVVIVIFVCGSQIVVYLWKKIRDFLEKKTNKKLPHFNLLDRMKNVKPYLKKRLRGEETVDVTNTSVQAELGDIPNFSEYREPLLSDDDCIAEDQSCTRQKNNSGKRKKIRKKERPPSTESVSANNLSNSESVWSASDNY